MINIFYLFFNNLIGISTPVRRYTNFLMYNTNATAMNMLLAIQMLFAPQIETSGMLCYSESRKWYSFFFKVLFR